MENIKTDVRVKRVNNCVHYVYRLYWTPAPPKMNLAPATIKSQLYPEYQGAALLQESLGADVRTATGMDSEDNNETEAEMEADGIRYRYLECLSVRPLWVDLWGPLRERGAGLALLCLFPAENPSSGYVEINPFFFGLIWLFEEDEMS